MSTKKSQRWIRSVVAEAAKCTQPMPWDRSLRAKAPRRGRSGQVGTAAAMVFSRAS